MLLLAHTGRERGQRLLYTWPPHPACSQRPHAFGELAVCAFAADDDHRRVLAVLAFLRG
ncbi:hypothetical protein [Kitasatospora sp. NPDC050543]|uniref:hypothetical protein n=1 Tax=Kitasatospora sp. NPDC050543 TaxID=3364054 RepID=UPI0037890E94